MSLLQPERVGRLLGDFLNLHADPSARHASLFLQLLDRVHRDVDRDCERETHVPARARINERVDADNLAAHVEQRPARVAGVDRDVGLDERDQILLRQVASLRADDSRGHRVLEPERLADRDHPFADLELVGIADRDLRQILRIDLQQRNVGALVGADDLGLELAAIRQAHEDFGCIVDHVRVGGDVTIRRNDEARAGRLRFEIALGRAPRNRTEALEEFVERIVFGDVGQPLATAHRLRHIDRNDRRTLPFVEVGEVRQTGCAPLRGGGLRQRSDQRDNEDAKRGDEPLRVTGRHGDRFP